MYNWRLNASCALWSRYFLRCSIFFGLYFVYSPIARLQREETEDMFRLKQETTLARLVSDDPQSLR